MSNTPDNTIPGSASGVVASLCLAAAFCLTLASSLTDQQRSIANLQKIQKEQIATTTAAHKAEDQLNTLAKGTQALANNGNANAAAVVAVLQRNGIKIKSNP